MAVLDRQAIRQAGIKKRKITVEQWSGDVFIRALLVRDRQEFLRLYSTDAESDPPYPADVWLLLKCVCDEAGNRMFADDDADMVLDMESAAVQKVGMACLELNGLDADAVEEAEGN